MRGCDTRIVHRGVLGVTVVRVTVVDVAVHSVPAFAGTPSTYVDSVQLGWTLSTSVHGDSLALCIGSRRVHGFLLSSSSPPGRIELK
jgi:hypothetical protein